MKSQHDIDHMRPQNPCGDSHTSPTPVARHGHDAADSFGYPTGISTIAPRHLDTGAFAHALATSSMAPLYPIPVTYTSYADEEPCTTTDMAYRHGTVLPRQYSWPELLGDRKAPKLLVLSKTALPSAIFSGPFPVTIDGKWMWACHDRISVRARSLMRLLLTAFKHGAPEDGLDATFSPAYSAIACRIGYLDQHYNAVFRLGQRGVISRIEVRGASNGEPVLLLDREVENCVDNMSAFAETRRFY